MQTNTQMKNSVASPRPTEPKSLNTPPRKIQRTQKIYSSGFTREEMRQIVAEQID